jgi:hypothetical protein
MPPDLQEPWASFLRALDAQLSSPVPLHCIGGFVMTTIYGVSRQTSDLDFLVARNSDSDLLQRLGGEGSDLHKRFNVRLHPVAIATYPEDYKSRLIPIWESLGLKDIRLFMLEPHDLALTKLERNGDVDRQDVQALARLGLIDPAVLKHRYLTEFRPNLVAGVERHDLTLELWIDMIRET